MFRRSEDYPFTRLLKANWETICAEAEIVKSRMDVWPEKQLYDGRWDTFGLYGFGSKRTKNCALCPKTTEVIERIPGLQMAGFSRLAPGTHIKPHCGYDGWAQYVLRCHLALKVNDGCALRVGPETRQWQQGKTMVFCDATEHEAWNRGTEERIVLLLDFRNPEFGWKLLNPALTPEIQEFIKQTWNDLTWREKASYFAWRAMNLFSRRQAV
jgi:beta-hydroxylase